MTEPGCSAYVTMCVHVFKSSVKLYKDLIRTCKGAVTHVDPYGLKVACDSRSFSCEAEEPGESGLQKVNTDVHFLFYL